VFVGCDRVHVFRGREEFVGFVDEVKEEAALVKEVLILYDTVWFLASVFWGVLGSFWFQSISIPIVSCGDHVWCLVLDDITQYNSSVYGKSVVGGRRRTRRRERGRQERKREGESLEFGSQTRVVLLMATV